MRKPEEILRDLITDVEAMMTQAPPEFDSNSDEDREHWFGGFGTGCWDMDANEYSIQWPNLSIVVNEAKEALEAARAAEARILETVADIAYVAGAKRYHSGDSREDVQRFIEWAREFETRRTVDAEGNETYNGTDYMSAVEQLALEKLNC